MNLLSVNRDKGYFKVGSQTITFITGSSELSNTDDKMINRRQDGVLIEMWSI